MIQKKTYKNWKEICGEMEWKNICGTYKKARLKELESLCRYHKEGNKFIIDEIYDKPKIVSDKRSVYQDDIGKLIMHECAISPNKTKYTIELSVDTILLKLSMINNNFTTCRNNINQTSKYLHITIEDLKKWYFRSRNDNKKRLESGLNKLQKQSYIKWDKIVKIFYDGVYRNAEFDEVQTILTAERQSLVEMGLDNKHELYFGNRFEIFNKKVLDKIKDKININYYFSIYQIIPSKQFEVMVLEEKEKKDVELKLNSNICEAIKRLDGSSEDIKKFVEVCIDTKNKMNLYNEIKLLSDEAYTQEDKNIEKLMESEGLDKETATYLLVK